MLGEVIVVSLLQVYLKLQCRCLLFSETYSPSDRDGVTGMEGRGGEVEGGGRGRGEEEDSDGENVWAAMETVEEDSRRGILHLTILK